MPFGVICKMSFINSDNTIDATLGFGGLSHFRDGSINIMPYLRPMSNMTEEEKKVYKEISVCLCGEIVAKTMIDWLNEHHFDYRGLIEKGLALEAPEGMYKF